MRVVLADSGLFIGLFSPKDRHHDRCRQFVASFQGRLFTTWQVLTEATALLSRPGGRRLLAWLDDAVGANRVVIECSEAGELGRMRELTDKYGNLPMDFADVSIYLLAVRLGENHVATVDERDFEVYRLPGNRRFVNVLLNA
jgi:uncharacterized protein